MGVVGEHPNGMDTCILDEPRLNKTFGLAVQRIELEEVFDRARRISQDDLAALRSQLEHVLDNLDSLAAAALVGHPQRVYRA